MPSALENLNKASRGRERFLAVREWVKKKDDWTDAADIHRTGPVASYAECQRALLCMWYYGEVERIQVRTTVRYRWIKDSMGA